MGTRKSKSFLFTTNQHEPTRTIKDVEVKVRGRTVLCNEVSCAGTVREVCGLILFFLLLAPTLAAQSGGYYLETRYVQRLTWTVDGYALRYEVIIEKEDSGEYRRAVREFTGEPFIEVSLAAGQYRYRVIPYDFFDRPGTGLDWINFEVLPAQIPEIREPIVASPDAPEPESKTVYAEKNVDVYIGPAWTPVFPLYGGIDLIYEDEMQMAGAALRFGMVFVKSDFFNPGIELAASWYAFDRVFDDHSVTAHTLTVDFNLAGRIWFAGHVAALIIRAGAGIGMQIGSYTSSDQSVSSTADGMAFHVNTGVSFLLSAGKYLYFEAGLDLTHLLTEGEASGYLKPWAGIGVQF
ncbi:MAG: hypothetical protein LBH44_05810 [Treponema sp.]|jgi:hypothetical protein|nr:hypothetical protein [Treponema sp.]